MCGLAGAILGKKRRRREELRVVAGVFTELLLLNQKRGVDASGVAVVRKGGSYRLFKRPWPAEELIEDKAYWEAVALDNKVTVLLGHTRWKTCGSEYNSLNNHPIRAGGVLGTHNGVITNADSLFGRLGLQRVGEVDSELLFRMADRARSVRAFTRDLSLCRGSISSAFLRLKDPGTLYLLKGNRPLSAAFAPRLKTVFYASERWMLRHALEGQERAWLELKPFTLATFKRDEVPGCQTRTALFNVEPVLKCSERGPRLEVNHEAE